MPRSPGPRHRETFAERRERRRSIDDPQVVLNAAARFLEVRSRSADEVRKHLMLAGYRGDLVEGAVERLTELGILNDTAFAHAWVESRFRGRPRSSSVLRHELMQKGIERELIDAAMATHSSSKDHSPEGNDEGASPDEQAADRLLARRAGAFAHVADPRVRRQRAYALLARNGFDPQVCRDAANRLVAGTPDEPQDD